MVRLRERREWLLALIERLPRTVAHLDVWENNLIRRRSGEIVLLDWAFTGDGALGEDVGNLILNSVPEPDTPLPGAYLRGLRDAGSSVDERIVRLGVCASAIKYDWLAVYCLAHAGAAEHFDYAGAAAALALCVHWADEAEKLAQTLGA